MKKFALSLLTLTLVLSLAGCGSTPSSNELNDTAKKVSTKAETQAQQPTQQQPTQQQPTQQQPTQAAQQESTQQKPPHAYGEFKGAGKTFTGGSDTAKDYNLIGFRRAPHPSFSRMIFDFGIGAAGTSQAATVPGYVVSMDAGGKKVTLELNGVNWNQIDTQAAQVSSIAPLINTMSITHPGPQKLKVIMSLNSPSEFQVFDLPDPARIAIVMAPIGN